ncbi:MAG TPA: type II secretion system protein [Candidatus Paceibacterota bacterium]
MIKRNKGFTLIELLVVIAIIGILSSVVLASLNTAREKARDARRISDIKQLQLALELSADDNDGNYPLTLAALATAGYISVIPTDPSDDSQYLYASGVATVLGSEYHIGATLEGGNMPDNDRNCDSSVATDCFAAALDGGFDGNVATFPQRYDQTQ